MRRRHIIEFLGKEVHIHGLPLFKAANMQNVYLEITTNPPYTKQQQVSPPLQMMQPSRIIINEYVFYIFLQSTYTPQLASLLRTVVYTICYA